MGDMQTWELTESAGRISTRVLNGNAAEAGATVVARLKVAGVDSYYDAVNAEWRSKANIAPFSNANIALTEDDASDLEGSQSAAVDFAASAVGAGGTKPGVDQNILAYIEVTSPTGFPPDVDRIHLVNHIKDVAVSTDILSDATPFSGADVAAIRIDTGTTIPTLITALQDLSQADVQAAMTAQGFTSVRAILLDNLDAAITSRESEISAASREATNTAEHATTVSQGNSAWVTASVVGLALEASVQSVLTTGGTGPWTTASVAGLATSADVTAAQVAVIAQGDAAWATATGFSVAGDAMNLTGAAELSLRTFFDATHGVGSWVGVASTGDWTVAEREQIRFRWSLDGTQTDPATDDGDYETILTRFGIGNQITEMTDATTAATGAIRSPPTTGTRLDITVTQTAADKVELDKQ